MLHLAEEIGRPPQVVILRPSSPGLSMAGKPQTSTSALSRLPLAKSPQLGLEQYCVGKGGSTSCCWWVERGFMQRSNSWGSGSNGTENQRKPN